jgi:hypothetical protein
MGVSGQHHAPAALYPPVPSGQEAGWATQPVWTQRLEEKSSASVGNRTPVVESVVRHYWLSYPGSQTFKYRSFWRKWQLCKTRTVQTLGSVGHIQQYRSRRRPHVRLWDPHKSAVIVSCNLRNMRSWIYRIVESRVRVPLAICVYSVLAFFRVALSFVSRGIAVGYRQFVVWIGLFLPEKP